MDISEAESSHLRDFESFHIDLNKYVKLSVAALNHLSSFSADSKELSDRIAELIKGAGERWYPTNYTDPHNEIADLKFQLTESAIMRVFSSFDIFMNEISGSYDEFMVNEENNELCTDYGITVQMLFSKFRWPIDEISYLLPVYHFYNVARHCIVHQMGYANKELCALSEAADYLQAIENWPTVIPGGQLSPPPTVKDDMKLDLSPHHAITYSDVCYRIATETNRKLIEMVGAEFIVKHLAVNRILKAEKLCEPPCKDSYGYLRHILQQEYKVKDVDIPELKEILEKEGLRQQCYKKHTELLSRIV